MILAEHTEEWVKEMGMGGGFVVLFYDKIDKIIERFSSQMQSDILSSGGGLINTLRNKSIQ